MDNADQNKLILETLTQLLCCPLEKLPDRVLDLLDERAQLYQLLSEDRTFRG